MVSSRGLGDVYKRQGPGPCIDQASIEKKLGRLQEEPRRLFEGRGAGDRYVREREQVNQQYAVLRIFVRGVDEDNIAALHEVVMRPEITHKDGTPLVAINQITDYYHCLLYTSDAADDTR